MAVGVQTSVVTRSGPVGAGGVRSGQYMATYLTERGPVGQPVEVRSVRDVIRFFGAQVPYGRAHDDLATFFAAGGGYAHVARVAGPAATAGTVTILDTAAPTPQPSLRVDAVGPGAWSVDVDVTVAAGSRADTKKITVAHGGLEETYDLLASAADAARALASSVLVRGTDLGGGLPADGEHALSVGNDDRAAVTGADHVAALGAFHAGLGDGAVACPGQPPSAVAAGLAAHAAAHQRVALLAAEQTSTLTAAAAAAATLDSEHVALLWPWVQILDLAGQPKPIPPEGYAAGCRAAAHSAVGPWQPPAAMPYAAGGPLSGVERRLAQADLDAADAARVSTIRLERSGRPRLYGWRSLSLDPVWRTLSVRDTVNRVQVDAEAVCAAYHEQPITAQLRGALYGDLGAHLARLAAAGGLVPLLDADGDILDPGWTVDVPDDPVAAAGGAQPVELGVRPPGSASLIPLTIVVASPSATLA